MTSQTNMTREQQTATRVLHHAEEEWLKAYGWKMTLYGWHHEKVAVSRTTRGVTRFDAVVLTRADLSIGWP